jgi:hypothetical protein
VVLTAGVAAEVGYDVVVAVNHALRGLRLADGHVSTLAGTGSQLRRTPRGGRDLGRALDALGRGVARDLAEPSDVLVDGDSLIVVESAAHRLVRLSMPAGALVDAGAHRVRRARTDLAPGPLDLRIAFTPPTGQHLDTRFGDPTSLTIAASPPSPLRSGAGTATGLERTVGLGAGEGVLQVSVAAAAYDDGDGVFAPATATSRTGASRSAWSTARRASWSWTCAP